MINKFALISMFILISNSLYASFPRKIVQVLRNSTNIAEVFGENGIWIVNEYHIPNGKLQSLTLSKKFPSQKIAVSFWSKNYKNWGHNKNNIKPQEFVNTESDNVNWDDEEVWSDAWEEKFTEWVKKEFTLDYFKKYNFATDCADVAVALRWIFARRFKLPIGIHLSGSGILFTHESMKDEWLT
jgi:hypothetical protein